MSFLSVENVSKKYRGHLALDKVSVSVAEGSIFGLLGPNGAGKTSLIRIINQITGPDGGEVLLRNKILKPADIRRIGYLPEERGLYKKMKVGEQAVYLARLKGLSRSDARKRLKYWFDKFEIYPWWDKKVEELSKGMQQKVQFIVTVLHEPELLIFDEPFSGFDPINAQILKQEILELSKKGSTILFSTHNMSSVEEMCSSIALINDARIILDGSVKEIRHTYKDNKLKLQLQGAPDSIEQHLLQGFSLLSKESLGDNLTEIAVGCNADTSSNELLASFMKAYQIVSFNEELPGMNEVFIKAVHQSNVKSQSSL